MKRVACLYHLLAILALLLAHGIRTPPAGAQDLRQVGRELKTSYDDAIAVVKIILQTTGEGNRPFAGEACGTVVSADGLVVVPLYVIDPSQLAKRLIGPLGEGLPLNTQVRDVKIAYGKAPEVAATVVLRDMDLGLALLRPLAKPAKPVEFVDLARAETAVDTLVPVITMTRLGNVASKEVALIAGSIQAVVTRPRRFFVPSGGFAGFGLPVFNDQGRFLGITMLQVSMGGMQEVQSGVFSLNLSHMGILPIILPAEQLKEIADQAPEKAEPLKPVETAGQENAAAGEAQDGAAAQDAPGPAKAKAAAKKKKE